MFVTGWTSGQRDLSVEILFGKETRYLGILPYKMAISTKDFVLYLNVVLCPYPLAPNKGGLEVSKKVQYVFVAQRAAKLCFVKLYEKLLQV